MQRTIHHEDASTAFEIARGLGFDKSIGLDGYPIDKSTHPFYMDKIRLK
jgi:hypothetical protein